MKKLLALVLAVMMLGTVAFAAVEIGEGTTRGDEAAYVEPGATIQIFYNAFTGISEDVPFTSEYFAITAKKFDKGAALVKSVAFNDKDECIEIKLVDDKDMYTNVSIPAGESDFEVEATSANLVIKELKVKSKKKHEDSGLKKNEEFSYDYTSKTTDFIVGYALHKFALKSLPEEMNFDKAKDFDSIYTYNNDTAFTKNGDKKVAYGTVKLTGGTYKDFEITYSDDGVDYAYVELRGYKNDVINGTFDMSANLSIVKKYSDAELTFLDLTTSGFSGKAYVEVYADEDEYLYEVVDGKLVATSLKWDDDAYAYVGKVSDLAFYVISDIKLDVASASTSVANPDTGANDVVGIAVALAAVAAVSAAAVSLKK